MTSIRNVAVIAHVDHGKTTLIDALLKQTNVFRSNQEEMGKVCILDSSDLEKERGITITAKNCSIKYKNIKINIIDTPGHADFSGEVERTLGMAEGALLIVDAQEGPMPQTRFVLKKALELGIKLIVVINKIDKPYARIPYVLEQIELLFLELVTEESQLNFPILYAIGRDGKVFDNVPNDINLAGNVYPLLDAILEYIPAPIVNEKEEFKMLISSFDYDQHLGRIVVGKINSGGIKKGDTIVIANHPDKKFNIDKIFVSSGVGKEIVESAIAGDIVGIAGISANIGETISFTTNAKPLTGIKISEPTMHITLGINTSPFAGTEGEYSTSRQLEERLEKELEHDLSLKIEKLSGGKFKVSGRGELHLAVFLEKLRREGYEMEVEKPQVIVKEIDGIKNEPIEEVNIIVPKEYVGVINQEFGKRYATAINVNTINEAEVEFIYNVPTRVIIGLRTLLLMLTKGTVLFSSQLTGFEPLGKPIKKMRTGVLIASETGTALAFGLKSAQNRGLTFIEPGIKIYEGMIIGKNSKDDDIVINVCKGKQLTNMRSQSSDGIIQLVPAIKITIEEGLDFIEDNELMEITPKSLRLRKKYLTELDRRRYDRKQRKDFSTE